MIVVKDLLKLEIFQNFTLLSGENGLNRKVSWPNIAQTPSIKEWLVKGDVIIMTGIGLEITERFLTGIVNQAVEGKAACLIVFLHPEHIQKIPEKTIEEAEKRHFPIFAADWDTKISYLIRDISYLLLEDRYDEIQVNEFLEKILEGKFDFEDKRNQEMLFQYHLQGEHLVVIVGCREPENGSLDQRKSYRQELAHVFTNINSEVKKNLEESYYWSHQDRIVFVINGIHHTEKEIKRVFDDIYDQMRNHELAEYFYIGMGEMVKVPKDLRKSYEQAKKSILVKGKKGVVSYQELGIYALLIEIERQEKIEEYVAHYFTPIWEYDRKNKQDYLNTLRMYLKCGGNLMQTSEALYMHRNTLMKRLGKLEELLGKSLKDGQVRNTLYNCFVLEDYLRF